MRKTIIIYALSLAALVFLLKFLEYRFLVHDLSIEFYLGVIALIFVALGVWVGQRLTKSKKVVVVSPAPDFRLNEDLLQHIGISKREYEVLELMAKGYSNQEIADKLFVSLNTVKTHISNLFLKLDVKRRTQAIQVAKDKGLIPR